MNKARLLVIDDDAIFRKLAGVAFGAAGLEVVGCQDGAAAQAALAAGGFTLVMLDLEVPGLDSFAMIAAVSAAGGVPVLVCSGRTDPQSRDRAMASGAVDFITKPVDWRALPARVTALLPIHD